MDFIFDMFGDGIGGGLFDSLGSGLFDSVGGLFGSGRGGSTFEDIFNSEFRAGAAEGRGFWSAFSEATDLAWDYQIWRDVFGKNGTYEQFKHTASEGEKEIAEHVRGVVKAHGFMLRQLRAHAGTPGIDSLLTQYEQLGTDLPAEDLIKSAYRKLSSRFHPDKNPDKNTDALMKDLNSANDALNDPKQRGAYEDAVRRAPEKIRDWLGKVHDGKFDETLQKAARAAQKRLSGAVVEPTEGFSKWLHDLSPAGRGAFIFGSIAATGVGIYMLAKTFDKKSSKPHQPQNWQHSVENAQSTQPQQQPVAL